MKEILQFVIIKIVSQIRLKINIQVITKWEIKSVVNVLSMMSIKILCVYFVTVIKKEHNLIIDLWDKVKNNALNVMILMCMKTVCVFIVIIKQF